jgi:hypothetical protein
MTRCRNAGGAGTFGVLSAAAAARRFEAAGDKAAPETEALGDHLAAVLEPSITLARQEFAAITT